MLVTAVGLLLIGAGCATQKQATDVEDVRSTAERGGFMQDYSNLRPTNDPQKAMLIWFDENTPWGAFDKVIVDPVQIWGDASSDTVNQPDLMALANYAHQAFVNAFAAAPWIETTVEPGPNTAIARFAITNAQPSSSRLKALTSVIPVGMAASAITEGITDRPAFAGQIQAEFMFLDSMTGQVYVKGVDRRVAGRSLTDLTNSWQAAHDALDTYADIVVYRVCLNRNEESCPKPEVE